MQKIRSQKVAVVVGGHHHCHHFGWCWTQRVREASAKLQQ